MEIKEKNNIILIQKVDYKSYVELIKSNILPLVIESHEDLDIEGYAKQPDTDLYILKIQYLKWLQFSKLKDDILRLEKTSLLYANGLSINVIRAVEEFEVAQKEEGFLLKTIVGTSFVSLKELTFQALKKKLPASEKKEVEKVKITSQAATPREYSVLRENHFLPFIVVLTEFEYRVMAKPFDRLYTKLRTDSDGKIIMVIDPFHLQNLVNKKELELDGIELLSGENRSIDEIYGGDLENNLGGFYINKDEYLSVEDYSKKILNPSTEVKLELKINNN
ncbi:MAG: hypothetical protein ACI31M_03180 [Bacilli bacterium]